MMKKIVFVVSLLSLWLGSTTISALNYGAGLYGSCQYGSCGISISTTSPITLNVTPDSSGRCTIAADTVSVTTSSSTGYTMQLASSTTSTQLAGQVHGGSISTGSVTYASPSALVANRWGYRIDSQGGFGAGPTSAQTNITIPATTFAGITSSASPVTIVTTNAPATPSDTPVWYGVCADMTPVADTYTRAVTYTAVIN